MTEKYPLAWRDACLRLMKARRQELHQSLGYKRMSWDPVRNDIMSVFETKEGKAVGSDQRLIRQNFDSWEKGSVMKDEKFGLIDLYVRNLALAETDPRAMRIVKEWSFCQNASVLSSMYLSTSGDKINMSDLVGSYPATFSSREIGSVWFSSVALRVVSTFDGVTEIVFAYLPVALDSLDERHFPDVVFYEGYLLPLEVSDHVNEHDQRSSKTVCAIKLTRSDIKGLGGQGYAEGEVHIIGPQGDNRSSVDGYLMKLDLASPVVCPNISAHWFEQNSYLTKRIDLLIPVNTGKLGFLTYENGINLLKNNKHSDLLDRLFDYGYKGYIL